VTVRLMPCLLLAAFALPAVADQANVDVRANIRGTCKIESVTAVDFGDLDQSTTAPDRTAPGTVRYWCSKGLTYDIDIGLGNNASGTNRRMKGQASTNATEFLPYQLTADSALRRTGNGPQTPVTFQMTGTVRGADYNVVSVGGFLDTIIVTVSP
jgi:spore coat protein U-like protein